MQDDPRYDDVLVDVYLSFEAQIAAAEAAGIARDNILIDPGFGFGKNVAHNLELMNRLALFHSLGCPARRRSPAASARSAPCPGKPRPTAASAEALPSRSRPSGKARNSSASTTCPKRSRR